MASVELNSVKKSFGDLEIIHDCNLQISEGEFIVLVGPSGCGKSTLLRSIAGLETINHGTLLIDGEDMTRADPVTRGVAMVFQSYALYPHMTVAENIGFGLKIAGADKTAIVQRVREVAAILHLDALLDRKPKALSGGQRQRVAIGRALARKPKIFLFDEPLSNLDAALRAEMRVELAKLHQEIGNTMIYVTHDQVEAMTLATRMVIMNAGNIEQIGTPLELFNYPATRFVAGFLGQPPMNFIRVASAHSDASHCRVRLHDGYVCTLDAAANRVDENAVAELGVRPEDMVLTDASDALAAAIEVTEQLGGETIIHARLGDGQKIVARFQGQTQLKTGDEIRLAPDRARAILFDAQGRNLAMRA